MEVVRIRARCVRVGNSVGFVVPAATAKEARIRPGMDFDLTLRGRPPEIFGFAKDLYDGPYDRRREGIWRDRL